MFVLIAGGYKLVERSILNKKAGSMANSNENSRKFRVNISMDDWNKPN
jgi:hypothetical protein